MPQILELVNEIEKQIYKRCLMFDRRKAINTYKELYSFLHENTYGGRAKFDKDYMERLDNFKITKTVITTNYDPIFETFIRTTQKKYSDGFTIDELGDITFKKDWNEKQDDRIQLVKLYGSIDYYLKEDRRVVKYDIPIDSPKMDIFGQRIIERMMMLPLGIFKSITIH